MKRNKWTAKVVLGTLDRLQWKAMQAGRRHRMGKESETHERS